MGQGTKLIAERGDQVSLMYLQPSASGARYQGRNEVLWEHHGEALQDQKVNFQGGESGHGRHSGTAVIVGSRGCGI